ncbi:VCBS repeat-containing protein [Croceitalea vernalis]|uniref:VCBS repeat-containing protein n=1 Tax=Croceitalea vernalis TaxID=3075599 RepID=A0ABU3BJI6_9FLAO|nr:VCBS repeat-containing protein [Croceitalea sp. P007]MDT0622318.1 VCBS repeat-containing protein [Croceitalea sp. P007]
MIRFPSFLLLLLLIGCSSAPEDFLFVHHSAKTTNINFSNNITETDDVNIIDFQYCYNGGGVGIGDFNNDELPDVVFTGNQVSSRIYLNNGDLVFTDISEEADFFTKSWITGVAIVDINSDGWDDIYLNVGGSSCNNDCPNLLFVNMGLNEDGVPKFVEKAKDYGLDDGHYAQQSVFFDYDLDGDLDVYIVHNGNTTYDKNTPYPKRYLPDHLKDYLLRNDKVVGVDHPLFKNVSDSLNINKKGFGLGVGINDFNNDNLPDLYVSNDFITEDLMWINIASNKNSSHKFVESSKAYLAHETYNAMGVDIADINNDAFPDILVLDMLPKQYKRQKLMLGSMNYDKYLLSQRNDYSSQYVRNTLQLGNGFINDKPIKASEVGFQKGISSTDWSWAPLMIDFDNDGFKDIFISNGYVKDITDLDFINYSNENAVFGTPEAKERRLKESIAKMPGIYLPNFFYKQEANGEFKDISKSWVEEKASFSNGTAYADLDLDGDLDLIVNNINENAFVLENKASENKENRFLRLNLIGGKNNTKAIGAKIKLYHNGKVQTQYQSTIRGYLSSVEPTVHFGVKKSAIDSLKVIWPNGKVTTKYDVKTNQKLSLQEVEAEENILPQQQDNFLFARAEGVFEYEQKDKANNEYTFQGLLSKQYTSKGSCIIAANIDGVDGDEIFVGASSGNPSSIWFQNQNGNYEPKQLLDSAYDDSQAVFFDIDTDGDLDLYVGSGGNRFDKESENYQDRIYLNDGKGFFVENKDILPKSFKSTSTLAPNDFDKDGDVDLFVGTRLVPKEYPSAPSSSFLINENAQFKSKFESFFSEIGMVTHAVWADIDNDSWQDLIVVGEFMEITTFKNNKGNLEPLLVQWLDQSDKHLNTSGWWNHIAAADFDNDNDIDFIMANQGVNGFLSPTQDQPIVVYSNDFDQNGSFDPVLAKYFDTENGEKLLPVHTRDDIMKQLTILKKDYPTYESFAKTDFEKLMKIKNWSEETLPAHIFESCYAENLGNGKFRLLPLPKECQVAPINTILTDDFDADGQIDFLAVGNDHSAESNYGKFDALTGILVLRKDGFFKVVPSKDSGFYVPEQSNHLIEVIDQNHKRYIVATQHNEQAEVFYKK